jgi:Flp pilus assembly pilin Flp
MTSLEYGLAAVTISAVFMVGMSALFSALGLMP